MHLLKALIVDDEPLARERLRGMLEGEPAVEVIGECADGQEALVAIRYTQPEVIFLDVEMPGGNGLQLAAQLPAASRPAVVFTTAHERFALEAFDVAAVDYLLKPFDLDRLRAALDRVRSQLGRPAAVRPAALRPDDRVAFRADGRIVFLRLRDITWAEADNNHVTLHVAEGRIVLRETLAAIEARLGPDHFTRINRSALVQVDQIKELQLALHGDYTVVLRDGTRLPLSRSLRGRLERFTG